MLGMSHLLVISVEKQLLRIQVKELITNTELIVLYLHDGSCWVTTVTSEHNHDLQPSLLQENK